MTNNLLKLQQVVKSQLDSTQKFVFRSGDQTLEVSYIDKNDGKDIICVPTQHGCNQGCLFCQMTGTGIAATNLSEETIFGAVEFVRDYIGLTGKKPLLISYMGCGEPLKNTCGLIGSMLRFQQQIPRVRFAIATILPKGCECDLIQIGHVAKKFKLNLKIHFSLHFTTDEQRQHWLPSAGSIAPSLDLLRWYQNFTDNALEIHYTPIQKINDSNEDAIKLSTTRMPIKLITFNPKSGLNAEPASMTTLKDFENTLLTYSKQIEVYTPPGRDIGASCGQFDINSYTPLINPPTPPPTPPPRQISEGIGIITPKRKKNDYV